MIRTLRGEKILIATHNAGKLEEFREIFKPHGVSVVSSGELALPEPAETESTFDFLQVAFQDAGLFVDRAHVAVRGDAGRALRSQ